MYQKEGEAIGLCCGLKAAPNLSPIRSKVVRNFPTPLETKQSQVSLFSGDFSKGPPLPWASPISAMTAHSVSISLCLSLLPLYSPLSLSVSVYLSSPPLSLSVSLSLPSPLPFSFPFLFLPSLPLLLPFIPLSLPLPLSFPLSLPHLFYHQILLILSSHYIQILVSLLSTIAIILGQVTIFSPGLLENMSPLPFLILYLLLEIICSIRQPVLSH